MKNRVAALVAVLVVLAAAGAGVGAWLLARDRGPQRPQISAYSHGHLTRVGPYQYCDVLNLNDCETRPQALGVLPVTSRDPVQLSVPNAIGDAPWGLSLWYEDSAEPTTALFRPRSRLAVTVPTVDAFRGRLRGLTVHLLTLVRMPDGDTAAATHADWSVQTVWD
ncbi:DUF2771 domain-containing protein [Mycobacterium sp. pUA109]|uniref:DUF2771 domain-containing protein n=1 Tax=Mycobacterium sp. pUA109 TaxID=3238982 RepID=UPI00351B4A23